MGQSSRCFVYLAANIKTFLCKVTTMNLKLPRQRRRDGLGEVQAPIAGSEGQKEAELTIYKAPTLYWAPSYVLLCLACLLRLQMRKNEADLVLLRSQSP